MYFCGNKLLEEKSLSLFSFQQWQPLAFELAFLEKLTTLRLMTTKPAKHSRKLHDYSINSITTQKMANLEHTERHLQIIVFR